MRKCSHCKTTKDISSFNRGGDNRSYICADCQKLYSRNKQAKQKQKILDWTNNGKCWWVYQSIMGDLTFWKKR